MAEFQNEFISQVNHRKLENIAAVSLRWTGRLLVTTVWVSAGLFGLYILAFYAASLFNGNLDKWNNMPLQQQAWVFISQPAPLYLFLEAFN
jgi:hypothetical protein